MRKFFAETPPPGIHPDDMSKHLRGVWCEIRNSIQRDQDAVRSCLSSIRTQKQTIKFLKERIVANHQALGTVGAIKGDK